MGFFSTLSRYGLLPATTIGNIITVAAEKITGKEFGRTTTKELAETKAGQVLGLATLGTAAAAAAAGAGVTGTITALRTLVPKTALGKTAALFVGGVAVTSPTIREAIIEAPFRVAETGKKVGELVEKIPEPVKEQAAKFGVAGLVTAGLVGAGITLLPSAIEKAKEFLPEKTEGLTLAPVAAGETITATPPITPETVSLEEPKKKAPVKRRREARRQQITQRVNVQVGVKQTAHRVSQKYLNVIPQQ